MKHKENKDQFNPKNERLKYEYSIHKKRVGRKDEKTIIETLKCLREFEDFIKFAGFETYNEMLADKYIDYLFDKKYSLSLINSSIRELKEFLLWLERKKGYRSKINYEDIDYLNISDNQRRMAKSPEYKRCYSYDEIISTIRGMPSNSLIEKRNKAIISLNALASLRVSELRTVKLKNVITEDGKYFIYVNPKDMEVKGAKTRYADFVALPDDILDNALDWKAFLVKSGFNGKDPLFPKIPNNFNQLNLLESNLTHEEIKSNSVIHTIFKNAFLNAGLEYIEPHSFRRTRAKFAQKQSPEYLNATRQALGHSSIDTTLSSYGDLAVSDQREIIGGVRVFGELDSDGKKGSVR